MRRTNGGRRVRHFGKTKLTRHALHARRATVGARVVRAFEHAKLLVCDAFVQPHGVIVRASGRSSTPCRLPVSTGLPACAGNDGKASGMTRHAIFDKTKLTRRAPHPPRPPRGARRARPLAHPWL